MPSRLQTQAGTVFKRTAILPVIALSSVLFTSGCSRFFQFLPSSSKHFTEAERRQGVTRFRDAIERAAGPRAWIKNFRFGNLSKRGAAPIEVLVEPSAFDAVVSALRSQAKEDGFDVRSSFGKATGRGRSMEVRISRRGEEFCRWSIRGGRLTRAAIVIDDLGGDIETTRRILALSDPVTLSVLPHLRRSRETAESAARAGREVMLHLPMEPEPPATVRTDEGAIRRGMSDEEIARTIETDLASVPRAAGVNNHMGSRATTQADLMTAVMKVIASRKLYFVDSRTTAESVALDVARRLQVPAFYRSVFLDDTQTVAYSVGQLRELRRTAEQHGAALAIGHPYPTTLVALAKFLPEFERADIELVPVSRLVRLPEVARLSPAHPAF